MIIYLKVEKTSHMNHVIGTLYMLNMSDIPTFYIKYLTMYKVHMHAGVIRKLLYGLCVCMGR